MRLDRWLHRRFPDVSNSHLMRIVRKGEVRVSVKWCMSRPDLRPAKACVCRRSSSAPQKAAAVEARHSGRR